MKHLTAAVFLLILMVSAIITGCSSTASGSGMYIPKPEQEILDSFDPILAGSANHFGINMFKELTSAEEDVFISPLSIAAALGMTYNGAGGDTKAEMAETLGVTDVELEKLNKNTLALLYLLQEADPSVKLSIANSLWMREGIDFNLNFVERNENYYNSAVKALDFDSPEAAETINRWVSERTEGRIEDMIEPPINPLTVMFLINAIHFQGDWTEPFLADDTRDDIFYLPDGETKTVPFMSRTENLSYYNENDFQAVRLPYGEEEQIAMYIFLPTEKNGLQSFIQEFTAEKFQAWQVEFKQEQGTLQLPKFSMEYEKSLNDVLKALGMETAFNENRADFFDMVNWDKDNGPHLYISEVKHKSFINIDEEGTEAAAATSVEIRQESAPESNFTVKADHPFLFLIHDQETDSILFIGTVSNPETSQS